MESDVPEISRDWKKPALAGYAVIFLTFGVVGTWAAMAKIDSAVIASGVVSVESNRKTVQHYEGGMISEILVKEGGRVEEGDVLFRLDATQAQSNLDIVQNQLDVGLAIEARLLAERDDAAEIVFPEELMQRQDRPVAAKAIADQRKQFAERRASIKGQISILEAKIEQLRTEISGLTLERAATEKQLSFINQELVDLNYLLEKQLVQKSRVLALEREKSRLEGIIGRSTADMAKAENSIGEARLQIQQLRQKFLEEVTGQISEIRQKVSDQRERLNVARDVFSRLTIRSPKGGTVQNLKVFTVGQVIKSGEPLLDVVPEDDRLILSVQASPVDGERIRVGMETEVRFPSFNMRRMPLIFGRVRSVSRDRLMDEATRQPYFLVLVEVDESTLPSEIKGRLIAGLPAEIYVPTGERAVLDYLLAPIQERVGKAFREQ